MENNDKADKSKEIVNNDAKESTQLKKTREKLLKHFDSLDRKITPNAINRKRIEIFRFYPRR